MKENINRKLLINNRKSKAWTQSHLAEVSGLSLRTVQRIEKTGKASFESIKSLASVFEIVAKDLIIKNFTDENTENKTVITKGKNTARIGLVLSYSILIALVYTLAKLIILYIGINSSEINNPKLMANGITATLTPSVFSTIISYFGVIVFGISKIVYSYNNNTYNKLVLLPIIVLITLMPIKGAFLLLLYLLVIKYSVKIKSHKV